MVKHFALALIVVFAFAMSGTAQLEWDRPHRDKPVANPSPVAAGREAVVSAIKEILGRNQIAIKSESEDETRRAHIILTEPVVFARGIVAKTQLNHFAEVGASEVQNFTRGRVTIRIEVTPTNPNATLVGVYGTFEGFAQGASQEWIEAPSRGVLEDKVLKLVLTRTTGTAFPDVNPDDDLLEAGADK